MCHWLMQHMRQPIPCQTVVYSTHTTAYVWIVCAQYKVQPTLISGQVPVVGALRIYFCSNLRVDKANKPETNLWLSPLFSPPFFLYPPLFSSLPSSLPPFLSHFPLSSQAQKSLVVARTVGDWVVHACTNCDTDVYILHTVKESRVFVTGSLLVRSGCGWRCGLVCNPYVRAGILGTQHLLCSRITW